MSGLDPSVRDELVAMFLDEAEGRVARIEASESAAHEAHTLAGGAVTAGLGEIAEIARTLEDRLRRGDADGVEGLVAELRAAIDRVPRPSIRTVLCIEDDPTSRLLVERVVARSPGTRLVVADSAEGGIELASQVAPSLILLDLRLPDLGGEEALARLRAMPETATTPIVVVSADASPERAAQLLELGAADYLTKPLDLRRLLDLLAAIG